MRADFARHLDSPFLGGFDQQHFFLERNMRDVDGTVVDGGK